MHAILGLKDDNNQEEKFICQKKKTPFIMRFSYKKYLFYCFFMSVFSKNCDQVWTLFLQSVLKLFVCDDLWPQPEPSEPLLAGVVALRVVFEE
jgi:hypothetical protein